MAISIMQRAMRRRALAAHVHHGRRRFSSQTNAGGNRVPKTLYRQLLAWCRRYDGVPFNPLPPVTLSPPQVNPAALKRLREMRSLVSVNKVNDSVGDGDSGSESVRRSGRGDHPSRYAVNKEDVVVSDDMITFPEITDANQLRATIRSVYWLNNLRTIENIEGVEASEDQSDGTKEQMALAFEAIKSCNKLSSSVLDGRREKRELSIKVRQGKCDDDGKEFPDVGYHVGQVIKHKEGWRGVIVGWAIEKDKTDGRLTSLTTKQYTLPKQSDVEEDASGKPKVQYTVLVDINDAKLLQSSNGAITLASEVDMTPVDDPCLQRIQNALIKQYFTKFDPRGNFVPNDVLGYAYPLDRFSRCKLGDVQSIDGVSQTNGHKTELSPELEQSSLRIANGVKEIGHRLLVPFPQSDTRQGIDDDDDAFAMISALSSNVQSMAAEGAPKSDSAISHLAKLYHFHVKIDALLWTRNINRQHKDSINFSLGQVVRHKIYGFRGLVGAWDAKPKMDVSNWDGLTGIENPEQKPFYHVYPDTNDCVKAFGANRHFRYVCQDNLELSPLSDKPLELEIDLDPEEWKWCGEKGRYIPSAEMKYMYAEYFGEHEATLVSTIRNLRSVLKDCLLEIRDGESSELFSQDDLFCQLQVGAHNADDALIAQDMIREIWKESPYADLRDLLDTGIADLVDGKNEKALSAFTNVIDSDPLYGEAWNKKATVEYMMGNIGQSIRSAGKALEIEDRNFQALAGLGLIEMDALRYDKAIESFRKCLTLNPWLATVSSRLSVCMSKRDDGSET